MSKREHQDFTKISVSSAHIPAISATDPEVQETNALAFSRDHLLSSSFSCSILISKAIFPAQSNFGYAVNRVSPRFDGCA